MTPLVFLPGAGGSAAFWRPVADRLADLGPARLLGWPGFGDVPLDPGISSLDGLYRWLLDRLPAGASHVVAQSMGGVLAARLAIEHPERVARLVLVATSGGLEVAALGACDWRPEYRAALPDVPAWFVEDRTDLGDRLGAIRAPTLLLWSDADPVSPLAVGRVLAERIAGSRLVTVPGGSHVFANERPDEVAAEIRAHLAAGDPDREFRASDRVTAAGIRGSRPRVPGFGPGDRGADYRRDPDREFRASDRVTAARTTEGSRPRVPGDPDREFRASDRVTAARTTDGRETDAET
ncbi:alpha/beta fold hydrolase [Anaeromyxobacter oryzae]|uniref:Alpha/beta hydrolase n=1 Tax=Anaeromyxobacter oryzae TaxID=2918170 RepID=A0ABN6MRW0_9BACT|nr:alpha/beta fold hydrolase [Anaeromyxobacter oryzae]BDG02143.1 hypothetical protein AMOR_11390 [Anaeromyxobacter oryzae]